jgi:hypothetical protein
VCDRAEKRVLVAAADSMSRRQTKRADIRENPKGRQGGFFKDDSMHVRLFSRARLFYMPIRT